MREIRSSAPDGIIVLALTLKFSHKGCMWTVTLRKGGDPGDVLSLNKQIESGFPVIEQLPTGNKIVHSHRNLTLRQACENNAVPADVERYIERQIDKILNRS